MCRLAFLFLLSILGVVVAQAQVTPIAITNPIEREIKGGESHLYQLTLTAGECARVELKADKARLNLSVLSEKNELIATISEADSPNVKRLNIVAERATNYIIRVALEYDQAPAAKYQLTLTDKHAATAPDRERFALHILSWEVVTLYRQQEKSALQQAADKGRAAAARWQALGEYEWTGRMLDRAARSLTVMSNGAEARVAYEQAIAAFRRAGVRQGEAGSLGSLAYLHFLNSDYQPMVTTYLQAAALWHTLQDRNGLQMSRYKQAFVYHYTGEWQKTEDLCRQLLTEVESGAVDEWDIVSRGAVLQLRGMAAVDRGELRQGISYLIEGLSAQQQSYLKTFDAEALRYLGKATRRLGELSKAKAYFEQALQLYQRVEMKSGIANVLTDLGSLYVALGRTGAARTALTEAVTTAAQSGNLYFVMARFALAQFQHDQGEEAAALTGIEQVIRLSESLRGQVTIDSVRVKVQSQLEAAYELQIDLLLHLHKRQGAAGYDVRALQANEAGRARSLLQLLSEKRLLPRTLGDSPLAAHANTLHQRIAALTNEQLRLGKTQTARREAVEQELARVLVEMDMVNLEWHTRHPRLGELASPEKLTLKDIQQQVLDRQTLLLEYRLGEERSFLFVVTPEGLHTFNLPSRAVIEPLARQVYEALSRNQQPKTFTSATEKQTWLQRNERAYEQAAAKLGTLILKPAAALLGNKRLLIVTDGALQYVPFAALPDLVVGGRWSVVGKNQNQPLTTSHRPPLLANHEIITLPSASTLAMLRHEARGDEPAPKTLAIFADPVFDAHDQRLTSSPHVKTPVTMPEHLRALAEVDAAGEAFLPRLPASRAEAEAILTLVPSAERRAALDFDVTYQAVTQSDLSQYRFVHFATHGLLNETHPELSGLLLSQVNHQGHNIEGFFTTLDAFNLKLNADLVVLSGCQTALGKEVKGEGLMGLTRGFMYAGARRVAASLWQVNDLATAELMQRFYQGMLGEKKLAPAAALRAAQLVMLRNPRWHSPYYWAAFTLQGEW